MKKILTIGLIVALTTFTYAANYTGQTKITKVMTYPGVTVFSVDANTKGCTFSNKHYLILDTSTTDGRLVYTAVLTAFTSGAKVEIAYDGCRNWWGATLPIAYRIDLMK